MRVGSKEEVSNELLQDSSPVIDYDYILKNYVGYIGKWQLLVMTIFLLVTASPYLLFGTFGNHMSPHYCRVAELDMTNWTVEEKRNFSIPDKPLHDNPMPEQTYQPCKRYKLPYDEVRNLTYEEALQRRESILANYKNISRAMESCKEGWIFDTTNSDFPYSIVTDFELVCDRSALEPLSNSIYFIGMMVGLAPWGAISDRIGRRKVAVICNVLLILVAMSVSAAQNYTTFVVLRFLTAVFTNGHFSSFYVLVLEIIGVRQRNFAAFYMFAAYLGSSVYLVGAAYFTKNWRIYHALLGTGPCFILLMYFVDESPRWLMATGRTEQSIKILRKGSKMNNKKPWPDKINLDTINTKSDDAVPNKSFVTELKEFFAGFLKLVRTPEMRKRTLIMFYIWFSVSGVYFGFTFYNIKLKGNVFIIVLLGILTKIPANLFQVITYDRIGRRYPLSFTLMMCALTSVVMGVILSVEKKTGQEYPTALIALGTMATGFVSASFGMIYVYTPELMPTVLRNVGIGSCSTVARIGAVIAPFLNQLRDEGLPHAPMFVYGGVVFAASMLCLLLPETRKQKMPATEHDVERWRAENILRKREAKLNCESGAETAEDSL